MMRNMEAKRIKIVSADRLNDHELAVAFSDRTTAIVSVEQLLSVAPNRMDAESDKPGR
jgi:hypothetical protein